MFSQIIEGIPVESNVPLPPEQLLQICRDCTQSRSWEGRRIGRLEIVRQDDSFCVRIYDMPVLQYIPRQIQK